MENKYLIYESAITAPIEQPKRNGNIVEFITVLQEADRKNRTNGAESGACYRCVEGVK